MFETDPATGNIVVTLPSLNYTADFGPTIEVALDNLKKLAEGFLEVMAEQGETIPQSDTIADGIYLSLKLNKMPIPTWKYVWNS